MKRSTRTHRPLGLLLLAAVALTTVATPAGAAATASTVTITDPAGDPASLNGAPTPAPAQADLVKAVVDHGTSKVTLTKWFAGGVHPRDDAQRHPDASWTMWWLDTDGDGGTDYWVYFYLDGGDYLADIGKGDTTTCTVPVSFDPATFRHRITVPRSCVGNPASIRAIAFARYGVAGTGGSYSDYAPDSTFGTTWSSPADRARVATTLSSKVSATTRVHGQAVTVSGVLARSSDGKALGGQPVVLYRKYSGGSYTKVATATTDSKGRVAFSTKPTRNARFQLRHAYAGAAGPGYDAAASPAHTVKVSPKVALTASATRVTAGTTVKLTTNVSPKHAGLEAKLQQRRSDGTWRTVQTAKLNSNSARTFKIVASKSTVGTYRVVTPKHDDHAAGTSPRVTVRLG